MTELKSEWKIDSWDPPEGYYERVANMQTNPFMHKAAITLTYLALFSRHGKPRVIVPESIRGYQGGAIIVPVHRSAIDTMVVPYCAEEAGLRHARPIAKGSLFENANLAWLMHNLGAFGVKRGQSDKDGLKMVQQSILSSGGNIINYAEGTRIHKDTRKVAELHRSVGSMAAISGKPIITLGLAGLSEERNSQGEVIASDKKAPFGIGPPVVAVFGHPIYAELDQGLVGDSGSVEQAAKEVMPRVERSLQACLDSAYRFRDNSP